MLGVIGLIGSFFQRLNATKKIDTFRFASVAGLLNSCLSLVIYIISILTLLRHRVYDLLQSACTGKNKLNVDMKSIILCEFS